MKILVVAFLGLFVATVTAQQPAGSPSIEVESKKKSKLVKVANYLDPALLDLSLILSPPPSQNSPTTQAELAEIHRMEQERTPAQVAAAQSDDHNEDIFLFAKLMGAAFNADTLPATATLSVRMRNDVGVVDPPLKRLFGRPRPYNFDQTLHPVCDTNKSGSYPSGHAFNGYLYAFALIQLVPEKRVEILVRADEYAHNRIICEAHYASDLEASRQMAYVTIGSLLANLRFQHDLAAARTELRQKLSLPPLES